MPSCLSREMIRILLNKFVWFIWLVRELSDPTVSIEYENGMSHLMLKINRFYLIQSIEFLIKCWEVIYSFSWEISTVESNINLFWDIPIWLFPILRIVTTGWPFCLVQEVITWVRSISFNLFSSIACFI